MSRKYDPDHILGALIDEYQQEQHFVFNKDGQIYARLTATEDELGKIPFEGKIDICLTALADKIAERLSR